MARKKESEIKVEAVELKKVSTATKERPILRLRRKTDFARASEAPAEEEIKDKGVPFRRRSDIKRCKYLTDSELVEVIHSQNREAYMELFQRYQKGLFVYMFHLVRNKEEVEDLLQNVFTKTYKNLHRFDTTRKFSSWIYRIAHNEAVNFIKRKSKRKLVSWEDVSTKKDKLETSSDALNVEDMFTQKEIAKEVDEALDRLPEKYKKVLIMRYFNEYSYQKIGKMLNKPVNTVGTLINRAKKKLVEVVEEQKKG